MRSSTNPKPHSQTSPSSSRRSEMGISRHSSQSRSEQRILAINMGAMIARGPDGFRLPVTGTRGELEIGEEDADVRAAGGLVVRRSGLERARVAVIHRPKYWDGSLRRGRLRRGGDWWEP